MLSMPISQSSLPIFKEANIFDEIHETLDQDIFKDETPRKGVIKFVTKTFFRVMDQHIPDSIQYFNLFFTGSLTTYQYSETSDMDISVWPNYYALQHVLMVDTPVDVRKQLIKIVIDEIDGRFVPGTLHPVQNFVVPPETYPQDMYKPGLRSAWDIQHEMWFVAPEKDRVHNVAVELPALYHRAADIADKMKLMLDHDPVYAKQLFKQIHKKRTLDQQLGLGDFSEGNIVYKYLLHEGLFDRLRNELGIYIARRIDDGKEEEMESQYHKSSYQDPLENIKEAQEHVDYVWPEWDDVHDASINAVDNHMGYQGQAGKDKIMGAIGNVQMQMHYGAHDDIFDTAANLFAKVQRQQAVVEGNKRTGTALALGFLENNGYDTSALDDHSDELVDILYHVSDAPDADEEKYIAMLADMFRKYCKPIQKQALWTPLPLDKPDNPVPLFDKAAAGNVAEKNIKVIYDFEKDRIILGTPGQIIPQRSKIVGEYDGSNIHMFSTGQEFLNSAYLKRLWHASFPTRPLNNIYFDGEPLKIRQAAVPLMQYRWIYHRDKDKVAIQAVDPNRFDNGSHAQLVKWYFPEDSADAYKAHSVWTSIDAGWTSIYDDGSIYFDSHGSKITPEVKKKIADEIRSR